MITPNVGDLVIHPAFPNEIAKYLGEDETNCENIVLQYSGKKHADRGIVKFKKYYPTTLNMRPVTQNELDKIKIDTYFAESEQSELLKTYIQTLIEAGPDGVINDCGCPKNEFWNYTCHCKTMVKLYHRFSVFKDDLTKHCGYHIEDVEMENGKHKTILISAPTLPTFLSNQ